MAAARSSWDGSPELSHALGKAGPSFGNAWGQDRRGECLASSRPPGSQTRSSFWDTSAPLYLCSVPINSSFPQQVPTLPSCLPWCLPRKGSVWGTSLVGGATDPQSSQEGGRKGTSQWRHDTGPKDCGSSLTVLCPLEFGGLCVSRGDPSVSTLREAAACSCCELPAPLLSSQR